MRRRRRFTSLIAVAAAIAALLVGVTSALAAFVPGNPNGVNEAQVRTAVDRGHAYLLTQQQPDGCWTSGVTVGVTALTVLALVNSQPGGYANLDATTKAAVDKGTTCLMAHFVPGPGVGEGTFRDCPTCGFQTYQTSASIWALNSVPSTPAIANGIAAGRQWLIDNQRNASDPAGRADAGGNVHNGGWAYDGGTSNLFIEHSNSSFAVQGLAATGGIPVATADLAQGFFYCLQRLQPYPAPLCSAGDFSGSPTNDGGFIYSHDFNKGGTQTSATGSGGFSMSLTGAPNTSPRISAEIKFLDSSITQNPCENNNHLGNDLAAGWVPTNTLRHYAVWSNFKAHESAGIPDSLADPTNYYYKLADCLVNENIASPGGNWPSTSREDEILATDFAMLTLEKVTPEPPISNAKGVAVTATEGTAFCATVATFTDADSKAVAGDYAATIQWGDGTSSTGTITGDGKGNFTVSGCHTYAEEGTYTITVTITDVDNAGNTATVTTAATVADAALTSTCVVPAVIPAAFAGPTATFTDASSTGTLSDFTATISWGDGTTSPGTILGGPGTVPYTVSGTHTYTAAGPFTITTTITDVGGKTTTATCTAAIASTSACGDNDADDNGDVNNNGDKHAGDDRDARVNSDQDDDQQCDEQDQDQDEANENVDQDQRQINSHNRT